MTPVTALGFDANKKYVILGDSFGNVEIWDCSSLIDKIEKNREVIAGKMTKKKNVDGSVSGPSKKKKANLFPTAVSIDKLVEDDIKIVSTRKRSHADGITWIHVIPKYSAYATSSYDCCAYIWAIKDFKRLGALFLGAKDPVWKFKVDEDKRKKMELKEAEALL